jgi:hypothetical protein
MKAEIITSGATHHEQNNRKFRSPPLWGWITGRGDPILATMRLTVVLSIVVILSAGILSFTALYDLFVSLNLFHPYLGFLFPILFDAAEITFAVSTLNAQLQGVKDRYAWRMVIAFTALGMTANVAHALHAWSSGRIDTEQALLAMIFTSLFPLSVALVTHNLQNTIKREIKRNELSTTVNQLTVEAQNKRIELQTLSEKLEQVEQNLLDTRAQAEAEQVGLTDKKAELEQEIATRKKELRQTRREVRSSAPKPEAEPTPETEQKAYDYLAEQVQQGKRNKEINGAELGRMIGTSESFGRRLKNRLLDQVRSDLEMPEPVASTNGTSPTG